MATSGGLKDLSIGRSENFKIDPRKIVIEGGFNGRDFSDPTNLTHIDELKASIRVHGVKQALTVRLTKEGEIHLSDGECRLRAVMELIDEGVDIKSVPCQAEDRYANEAQRIADQRIRNSGKQFTPLENAHNCQRLVGFGWTPQQIADHWGITTANVSQLLAIHGLPEAVKKEIRAGNISATLAAQTVSREGESKGTKTIDDAIAAAKAAGKEKATKKTVERVKAPTPAVEAKPANAAPAAPKKPFPDIPAEAIAKLNVQALRAAQKVMGEAGLNVHYAELALVTYMTALRQIAEIEGLGKTEDRSKLYGASVALQ